MSIVMASAARPSSPRKMQRWIASSLALLAMTVLLAACGHQTPLVKPSEIPAYEQKRKEKREKYEPYREENDSWF